MSPHKVPLTQGKDAVVSPEDFRRVMKHKWCVLRKRNGRLYAQTNMRIGGLWRRVLMHRFVMGLNGPLVDHRDNDGLNNTRENMRPASRGNNQHNTGKRGRGSSRFKGVSWNKNAGKWLAQIMADRKYRYLGLFVSEEDAAKAYDAAARKMHGEFAKLNFAEVTA